MLFFECILWTKSLTHFGSLDFISGFVKFLVETQSVILNNSS